MSRVAPIVLLAALIIGILSCTYTLKEWEQGLVLQFGEYKRVENPWTPDDSSDAGLKFKWPWESAVSYTHLTLPTILLV